MASTVHLSQGLRKDLAAVHVGDIVTVKSELMPSEDENDDLELNDGDAEDSNEDGSDDEIPYSDLPAVTVYRVIVIARSPDNQILDLTLGLMSYVLKPADRPANYFHVYGDTIDHNPDINVPGLVTQSLTQLLDCADTPHVIKSIECSPSGDSIFATKFHGQCPAQCTDGWLTQQKMHELVAESMQTLSDHLPVCPVCIGKDLTREYQDLRELRDSGFALDLGILVEFYGRLNPRRRLHGYSFHQFDEREWGYHFEDMLSEDEDDDGGAGAWDYYDDALDTSVDVVAKPASEEAVKALARSTFAEIKQVEGEDAKLDCQICQENFKDETVVTMLPCGHLFCSEVCIETWLKQSASCPVCRYRLPMKEAETKVMESDGERMEEDTAENEDEEHTDDDEGDDGEGMASDEEEL